MSAGGVNKSVSKSLFFSIFHYKIIIMGFRLNFFLIRMFKITFLIVNLTLFTYTRRYSFLFVLYSTILLCWYDDVGVLFFHHFACPNNESINYVKNTKIDLPIISYLYTCIRCCRNKSLAIASSTLPIKLFSTPERHTRIYVLVDSVIYHFSAESTAHTKTLKLIILKWCAYVYVVV